MLASRVVLCLSCDPGGDGFDLHRGSGYGSPRKATGLATGGPGRPVSGDLRRKLIAAGGGVLMYARGSTGHSHPDVFYVFGP